MFNNASNFVQDVDKTFAIIIGISLFFLLVFTAAMIHFVVKYNRKKNVKAVQIKDNTLLEITWTVVPLLLVFYMFYIGWQGFLPMRTAPKDAMQVKAIGKMWKWYFEYEGDKQSDTLYLPINKAVKIDLVSTDVLHGFFIPAFRVKEDVVPGKPNYTWFIPGELGEYDLLCSVYCGLNHSYMSAIVKIVPEETYLEWLAALPVRKPDDDSKGFKIIENNGCIACHSIDGTNMVGPTFKGLYGSTRNVITNKVKQTITADSVYIATSIFDPNKDLVEGYPQGVMKSYKGLIKENEIKLINEYLKNLE
jgi:cytochrome c oxidase subunit 2